jgi:hypothetical protein
MFEYTSESPPTPQARNIATPSLSESARLVLPKLLMS